MHQKNATKMQFALQNDPNTKSHDSANDKNGQNGRARPVSSRDGVPRELLFWVMGGIVARIRVAR